MTLENLAKRIRKELLRNKLKSAVLGAMLLIALYFWVPLVGRWAAGESASPASADAASPEPAGEGSAGAADDDPGPPVAETPAGITPKVKYRWNQLVDWMDHDPFMMSAALSEEQVDPFRKLDDPEPPVDPVDQVEAVAPPRAEALPDIAPEQLGLVLDGTFIGRKYRAAKIKGVRYREKSAVVVPAGTAVASTDNAAAQKTVEPIEFQLAEIHPKYVVLTRNGRRFPLRLHRPNLGAEARLFYDKTSPANN